MAATTIPTTLGSWTEQHETSKQWYDCGWCAALTALVYAGYTQFPKGIYTLAERDALVAASNKDVSGGATIVDVVDAVKSRYGVALTTLKTQKDVFAALNTPGQAIVLQGESSYLPKTLQNGFTGAHAITVIPVGNGQAAMFDPLDPMNAAPKIVSVTVLENFFSGLPQAEAATIPLASDLTKAITGSADASGSATTGGGLDFLNPATLVTDVGDLINGLATSAKPVTDNIPNPVGGLLGGLDGIAQGIQSVAGSLGDFLSFVLDPQNWLSMIAFLGSTFLVGAGGYIVLKSAAQ